MGLATVSIIASANMLKSQSDKQTEEMKNGILIWVLGSVVLLVLILIFNQHRAAGIEEWGPSRGLYTDAPWIEMGNRDRGPRGHPQQSRYPIHPQPAIAAPGRSEGSVYRHLGASAEYSTGRNRFNMNVRDDRFGGYPAQCLPLHQNRSVAGSSGIQHGAAQVQVRDPSAASSVDSGIGIARSSSLLDEETCNLGASADSTKEESIVASEHMSSSGSTGSILTETDTGYLSSSESDSPPRRSGLPPRDNWCLEPSFSSSNLLSVKSGMTNTAVFPPRSSSFNVPPQGSFSCTESNCRVETNFSYPYSTAFKELSPILEHASEDSSPRGAA
ncbi:hypothetical protein Daesc_010599 [Daldinia eschscholtzii]|uniref:Uncharacterized protein n=1 Tax=Daldinia eschscholtzii TaxID=292717 RepID=A0AAX6M816_9PEZI